MLWSGYVLIFFFLIILKQNWLPSFWKKIQSTQEIKRMLFNWTKRDKMCKFLRKSSFSSYVQGKNKCFNWSCVSLMWEAGRRKRARDWGKGHEESVLCRFPPASLPHPVTQDKLICFSVFMLYIAWKRGLPQKFARFIQLKSIL